MRGLALEAGDCLFIAGASGAIGTLAIQPGTGDDSIETVRDGGRLITVSGDAGRMTPVRDIAVHQMEHGDTRERLRALVDAVARGHIRVEIEKVYPFDEALDALAKTETRHARGKVVVKVPD